jgi:predicted RNA binding protein YcfA (HicA-like mRNA interferase family)
LTAEVPPTILHSYDPEREGASVVTVQEVIKVLEERGWQECGLQGELRCFRHPDREGLVTLNGKLELEVPPGALRSLRRYALQEEDD